MRVSNYRSVFTPLAVAAVGAICTWGAWVLIQPSDEQNAKLAAAGLIALTSTVVMYLLHRLFRQMGYRWIVPAGLGGALVLFLSVVQLDGFTGEMYPILSWRWSSRSVQWQEKTVNLDTPAAGVPETGNPNDVQDVPQEPRFSQFLGNDRNGIIAKREFSVPQSPDEVEILWDIGIGGGWASFAIADSIAVTLEQREKFECLTAYDLETGALRWIVMHPGFHFNTLGSGGPRSTPTIVKDRVFAQSATGIVWCVDLKSGEVVWKVNLIDVANWSLEANNQAISWGRSGSPLLIDGQVILPLGGPKPDVDTSDLSAGRSLVSLDAQTGKVRWRAGTDQISYASPVLMTLQNVQQIVSVNEQTVTGHAIETGKVLWSFDWFGQTNGGATCAAAIPAGENRLLMGKGYSGGSSLMEISLDDKQDWIVKEIWHSDRFLQTKFNHALVMQGTDSSDGRSVVAFGIGNGALEAVDLSEPSGLWRQSRKQRCGQGQALLVEDVIVLQTEKGPLQFVAANPDEFRVLLEVPGLDSKTWNIPTVAGRYILVRNDRRAIAMKMPQREDEKIPPSKTP